MRRLICVYSILTFFLALTSCSTTQYHMLFREKKAISDSVYRDVESAGDYKIKAQDILQVRNLQDINTIVYNPVNSNTNKTSPLSSNSTESQTFQVDQDGFVILPALGRIKIAGYTRLEAQKIVEDAYRKDVFTNPIIELKITSLKVTFFGEIKNQGNLPLIKEHTSLVEMIGYAGGLTDKADESNIKIIRGTEKNPKVILVDLGDIQSINDPKAVLQNGDIIYIAQNKRSARNDNFQNFSTSYLQPVLLLFNTALIILTLVRH